MSEPTGTTTVREMAERTHPRGKRAGTAATELALILPLLMLILFACTDLGRFAYTYIALSNAARAGAEYGATHQFTTYTFPFWESQVREAVLQEMKTTPGFDAAKLSVTVDAVDETNQSVRVDVQASYPFDTITGWPGIPAVMTLRWQVSMRQFR
ncbi:MAG: pilus assembly protein [Planctomycetes bacterium]|nr:pilus assembly protein [Planctomycetota bacterium]